MKYKLLKDCNQGDWVYYDAGELCMVDKEGEEENFSLTTGYIRTYTSENTKVYPLTLHNKIIADGIYDYYKDMHKNNLINGSKWVNWLNEKMGELMELDENAPREDFKEIWDSIAAQIRELKYHKSFLQ